MPALSHERKRAVLPMRIRAARRSATMARFTTGHSTDKTRRMLRYLGSGPRQFGLYPLKRIARMNWEFFAVVKGCCAPILSSEETPPLLARTLWVSAPGSMHTWAGDG